MITLTILEDSLRFFRILGDYFDDSWEFLEILGDYFEDS